MGKTIKEKVYYCISNKTCIQLSNVVYEKTLLKIGPNFIT